MRVFSALYIPLFNPIINMDEFLLVRTEFTVQKNPHSGTLHAV